MTQFYTAPKVTSNMVI